MVKGTAIGLAAVVPGDRPSAAFPRNVLVRPAFAAGAAFFSVAGLALSGFGLPLCSPQMVAGETYLHDGQDVTVV